jgi:hypothetical protein
MVSGAERSNQVLEMTKIVLTKTGGITSVAEFTMDFQGRSAGSLD